MVDDVHVVTVAGSNSWAQGCCRARVESEILGTI